MVCFKQAGARLGPARGVLVVSGEKERNSTADGDRVQCRVVEHWSADTLISQHSWGFKTSKYIIRQLFVPAILADSFCHKYNNEIK